MPLPVPGYHLDRQLGSGGEADVWLGWPEPAGEHRPPVPVAVKVLRHELAEGEQAVLRRHLRAVAAIDHPFLLPLLDVVQTEAGPALVLPYVSGGSLRQLLDERGTLGAGAVVAVLGPVAVALAVLHHAGLVHGDVKPDNVLIHRDGRPVLADAGLAVAVGRSIGAAVLATPEYLDPAPRGYAGATTAADGYALGITAYELLTGRRPHRGEPVEVLAAAAGGAHRSLATWPGIAPGVAAAVEAAIDPDPDRRSSGPLALMAALCAVVDRRSVVLPGPVADDGGERPAGIGPPRTLRFGPDPRAVPSGPVRRRGWSRWWPFGARRVHGAPGSLNRWPTKRPSQSRRCH
ncbi:MAG: serine/threonine protein kinase [Acidimicrobiales bacterium]|nr:serine/threonine protein kinase [Acidimicrobiales bacterium]